MTVYKFVKKYSVLLEVSKLVCKTAISPKRDAVTGEWRRLHNKELYTVYSSPNIRVIKSRRMRCSKHVARMNERKGTYKSFNWGDLKKECHLKNPCVDGRIILKYILKEWDGGID